jgi:predicted RNase H-like nuclease
MSVEPLFVGVARAAESWLAVAFGPEGFEECTVAADLGDLWVRYEERAELVLVGVPVGLIEHGEPTRECDALAREVLGPRAEAVIEPPVREAARKRRFPAAQRVNERKAGAPVSRAAFELGDAIVEADDLLGEVPEARAVVAESHPEVCFRAFAGDPLSHPPDVAAGYAERLRTLAEYDPEAAPTLQAAAEDTEGADVTVADVLDALALAYTARPGPGSIRTLPPEPPTDDEGLPMRIAYRAEAPLTRD